MSKWLVKSTYNMIILTDYGRPEKKQSSLHGQKFNPNPKFLGTAEAYFVCHIGPIFQISLIYTVNDFRQVPTMIVGKTFVTGVQRFCQLILMLKCLFQVEGLHKLHAFNLEQVFNTKISRLKLYKLQAFNLKQVFNIKISWQNL